MRTKKHYLYYIYIIIIASGSQHETLNMQVTKNHKIVQLLYYILGLLRLSTSSDHTQKKPSNHEVSIYSNLQQKTFCVVEEMCVVGVYVNLFSTRCDNRQPTEEKR